MGMVVVTVAAGGMPVIDVTATKPLLGMPVYEAANGYGVPVTKVASGGMPVTFATYVPLPPSGGDTAPNPAYASVVLLAGWEGANGATTYSDEKSARVATFAGARISTAQFKFGTSCFEYNGGSVSFPDSVDWQLSTANSSQFCIEFWLRPTTATPGTVAIIGQDFGVGDQSFFLQSNVGQLEFYGSPTGSGHGLWAASSGLTWAANTWYHVAISKDGTGKVRLFRDGVMIGSSTPADSRIYNANAVLNCGNRIPFGAPWPGFMDELRITKGDGIYTTDAGFTPPAAAFPRS